MCINCDPNQPLGSYAFPYNGPCTNCDEGECPSGIAPTNCIYYPGPGLTCIGAETNERLSTILQKIDAKLCTLNPDVYSTYNTFCLAPINTEKEFVEAISDQFCTLRTDFTTFTSSTFPTAIAAVNTSINTLNTPNVSSCVQIGFVPTDTIKDSLQKLSNAVCSIYNTELSVAGVNWAQCSVVPTPPTTIVGGFNFLISQICNLSAQISGSVVLPTFDNTGTCLSSPTTFDSLSATIVKMRSRLCATPTFNANALTWNCISNTATSDTDLQSAFQAVLTKIDTLSQNLPTFNAADFVVNATNPAQPCAGNTISLAGPSANSDRFVAVNNADASPGTLVDKLIAGTNIVLDTTTTPGAMVVNFAGSTVDEKVKTSATDPTAGFLEEKITGSTGAVVSIDTNTVSNQVEVSATVDMVALATQLFAIISSNETLKEQFCALMSSCPSPCNPPSNITVTYVP